LGRASPDLRWCDEILPGDIHSHHFPRAASINHE
jgi:hypothetical protein